MVNLHELFEKSIDLFNTDIDTRKLDNIYQDNGTLKMFHIFVSNFKSIKSDCVVYNTCFGGFGLSDAIIEYISECYGVNIYPYTEDRQNIYLISTIQHKGEKFSSGEFSELALLWVYNDKFTISDYDGKESIHFT